MAYTLERLEDRVVGSYPAGTVAVKITTPANETSEAIAIPGISRITGVLSFVALNSSDALMAHDAVLTWSGNVLTIADGSSFDYSAAAAIYVTLFCQRNV
jgi:hypothetical protein